MTPNCGRHLCPPQLGDEMPNTQEIASDWPIALDRLARVRIEVGGHTLYGRLEEQRAPVSCGYVRTLLPLNGSLIHCR